jgi:serine protease Do
MPLTQLEESITGVVERVGPSVVTITTMQVARDQFLRPFPLEGVGSGVLIDADGTIVTNHHVVNGAKRATVHFSDGTKADATYLGGDADADIAVLRVPRNGLPAAKMGDSTKLRVGQLAIAIGSPFGQILQGPTVTAGVVSALHRRLQSQRGVIEDLIQSDAPINPGNSGGPLLNSSGEVIGINTAIIPYAQGIGFAVPSHVVQGVVDTVLKHGNVARPWIGISALTHTQEFAKQNDIEYEPGALVFHVEPGSPADDAGIRAGDLIVELGGDEITSVENVKAIVTKAGADAELAARVIREGRILKLLITPRDRGA